VCSLKTHLVKFSTTTDTTPALLKLNQGQLHRNIANCASCCHEIPHEFTHYDMSQVPPKMTLTLTTTEVRN